jgi:hypothetical protein
MFSALRLVLFDDGNILRSVALTPLATWAIIVGAGYSVVRAPLDVIFIFLHNRQRRRLTRISGGRS